MLLLFYVRPITLFLYAKWELRNAKEVWVVPTPLPAVTGTQTPGRAFSYFGIEFESPWAEVQKERKFDSVIILNFANGEYLTLLDPAQMKDELKVMRQEASKRGARLEDVFSKNSTSTKYALHSKIWNLTPGDLRLFSSRQDMVANSILLILKKTFMTHSKGALYSFQTQWFHGFQQGDPAKDDAVIVEAFDEQDREVEMYIGCEHGSNPRPSQADITRIINSLHPASASHLN